MSDTIRMLDAFGEAFNRHDLDAIMEMMTEDCVFLASGGQGVEGARFEGQGAVRAAFAKVFETFPDAQWNDARHFASGERACSEWRFTCTQPDSQAVEKFGCDLFHIRDGKVHIKNTLRKQMPG
jgi:ketosteroid isomerase-like protein